MKKTNESALYIHIPFCRSKCDYCDFFSVPCRSSVDDEYIRAVINESLYYSKKLNLQSYSTIYIGGGTPSLLQARQIENLLSGLKNGFAQWIAPKEVTMEMNPQSLDEDKLKAAQDNGVDRLSLGIQSFTEKSLDSVHRICSSSTAEKALDLVKKVWKGRLNLDCIAGLPNQSDKEFVDSLKKIISYKPDHISMYTLTIEDGTPLAKQIDQGMDYDFDKADGQWLTGREILKGNGFSQYEVSNFSLPEKRSIHNMSYWLQKDYIGIGAGATGTVYNSTQNEKSFRWTNAKDIKKYTGFWNKSTNIDNEIPREIELLDDETLEFEFLMMGLRTLDGLDPLEYEKRFSHLAWNGDLEERLGRKNGVWKKFEDLGRTNKNLSTKFALNEDGILFLNTLLREYL